jgi:aspartyl-tRNA(Asn)/glutamyl-tRNA(Gln) amidotransferase subunit C
MTQISRDDVARLATMSSLQLADDEIDSLAGDIERILGYVEQLNELDVEGVKPTYQVNQLGNVWRTDEPNASLTSDELLALAPEKLQNQIKVPKVL